MAKSRLQAASPFSRLALYAVLILLAVLMLAPLYVMLITSFKSVAAIREGNLLSLPSVWLSDAWAEAWSSACTGVRCQGLKPYFFNSLAMTIPAVGLSTIIGALNGYVLSFWRFRGAEWVFTALLLGCFIPFQVVLLPMARMLGSVGASNSIGGLIFVHV
ncbi:MAG: hypothetical protein RLZZ502_1090, partial [Pseudomonadota bacterium]